MISQKLHVAIDKWIKVDTWHTGHPSDDGRFHALLAVIESEGASNFDVGDFIEVTSELASRHHPNMKREFVSENIHHKALQAEAIMGYTAFCQRLQI